MASFVFMNGSISFQPFHPPLNRKEPLKVHSKIDTGMGRLGVANHGEAIRFISRAMQTEGVTVMVCDPMPN
jgi:alanine racemase